MLWPLAPISRLRGSPEVDAALNRGDLLLVGFLRIGLLRLLWDRIHSARARAQSGLILLIVLLTGLLLYLHRVLQWRLVGGG